MEAALISALLAEPYKSTTAEEYEMLKQLTEQYPYYAGFHALLAKQALTHESDAKQLVTKAATFAPDRQVLKKLMDSKPFGAKSAISYSTPPVSKPVTIVSDIAEAPEVPEVWVVDQKQAPEVIDDGKPSWMRDTNEKPVWLLDQQEDEQPVRPLAKVESPKLEYPEVTTPKVELPEEELVEEELIDEEVPAPLAANTVVTNPIIAFQQPFHFSPIVEEVELSEDLKAQIQTSDELVDELLSELDKLRSLNKNTPIYFGKQSAFKGSAHEQYDIELAKLNHDYSEGHEPITYIEEEFPLGEAVIENEEVSLAQVVEEVKPQVAQPALSLYERMLAASEPEEATADINSMLFAGEDQGLNDEMVAALLSVSDLEPDDEMLAAMASSTDPDLDDEMVAALLSVSEPEPDDEMLAAMASSTDQDLDDEMVSALHSSSDDEADDEEDEYRELTEQEIINKFLDANPRSINLKQANPNQPVYDLSAQNNTLSDDDMTETLAQIMVKQGKMDKAIEIYCKLILKNPEKTPYFASRINALATAMGEN